MQANSKMSKTELFNLAAEYNVTLEAGDARKASTKEKWANQINERIADMEKLNNAPLNPELPKIDTFELYFVICNFRYYRMKNNQKPQVQYISEKFGCTVQDVIFTCNGLVNRGLLKIEDSETYELTISGSQQMAAIMDKHQIFICVIDGIVKAIYSHREFYRPTPEEATVGGMAIFNFTNHKQYKLVAAIHDNYVRVVASVSRYMPDVQELTAIIHNCGEQRVKDALAFWKRYYELRLEQA